jgi:hypothetical protein
MNIIPLTVVDNFLDNPNSIKKWALSLEYKSEPSGEWPGKRSEPLHLIHPYFYNNICKKVFSLFFEKTNNLNYQVNLHFQLIENYQGKGWIHQDPNIFTFIIYLHESNPQIDCGTTLWSLNPNLIHPINSEKDVFIEDQRLSHHKNENYSLEHQEKQYRNYTKEISIRDKYNRLIAFSSDHFHSANYLNNKLSSRLTLIGFVWNISNPNLPIIRNKRVPMI